MKDNNEEEEVINCFAHFGTSVYMAQTIEKGIMNILINHVENFTKTRHAELVIEKSQLTFGQLKRELKEKNIFGSEFEERLDWFHSKRDWLAHNYWWDRAIEFNNDNLRYKIIEELEVLITEFQKIDEIINIKVTEFISQNGGKIEEIMDEFSKFDITPEILILRKLTKNETLVDIMTYTHNAVFKIPIFKLKDNSYWTLGDSGLTLFNLDVETSSFEQLMETAGIFPVNQFNPKPAINANWDYKLDLKKKGLFIKVEPTKSTAEFVYKWSVKKNIK